MALDQTFQTLLILDGMGIPLYSSRGLTQTLEWIDAAISQDRTVNGVLIDTSYEQFDKFTSVISCKDLRAPRMDGVRPGKTLTVSCVCELCYPIGGTPVRPVVPGSNRIESGFIFYRPVLVMMLGKLSQSKAEWPADVQWQMPLVEV